MATDNSLGQMADLLWGAYYLGEFNNLFRDENPTWRNIAQFGYSALTGYLQENVPKWTAKSKLPTPDTKTVNFNYKPLNDQVSLFLNDLRTSTNNARFDLDLKASQSPNSTISSWGNANLDLDMAKMNSHMNAMSDFLSQPADLTNPNYFSENAPLLDLTNGPTVNLDGTVSSKSKFMDSLSQKFSKENLISGGAGALAGTGVGMGLNYGLGKAFGNSAGGLFAALTLSTGASTVAGNVAGTVASNLANGVSAGTNIGSNLAGMFSNAGSVTSLGAAVGNIALDVFDKRKKAKWESGVNLGLGIASVFSPWVALGSLAFNGIGHAFGGSIEKGFKADRDMLAKATTYSGAINKSLQAESLGGLKYTLWANHDRHNDEGDYYEGRRLYDALDKIVTENEKKQDIAAGNLAITQAEDQYRAAGKYSLQGTHMGKQGMVILPKPTSVKIHTSVKLVSPVAEFKEGGSINVIPEGALHARLHHMENDENITKKGIPVISEKEGGEIEQLAEIERQEIIFRLEVTKKLEELAKDGSDEAALEAGKLLVEEILYNTIDNTNSLI